MIKYIALRTVLGVWAAAASLLALSASGWAAVVYDVNRTIGAGGVTGFIETDGTIGTLVTANIVDWTLTLNDGVGTFDLFGPASGNNSAVLVGGTALTATATNLLFDFDAPDNNFALFQNPNIGSGINFYCVETGGCNGLIIGETVFTNGPAAEAERSEVVAIATARDAGGAGDVPEPASILLLGAGLGGLGRIARRRRKSA